MDFEFTGIVWFWKGHSPYFFVTVPEQQSHDLKTISELVTYGWGMIPVHVRIGDSAWKTSLFPKDGLYILPLKDMIRKAENLAEGDTITVSLEVHL